MEVIVATSKRYGALLEMRMNRSFLRRTLNESRAELKRFFTKHMPGDGKLFKITGGGK